MTFIQETLKAQKAWWSQWVGAEIINIQNCSTFSFSSLAESPHWLKQREIEKKGHQGTDTDEKGRSQCWEANDICDDS